MYRDDLEAAQARARALEHELEKLKHEQAQKQQHGLTLRGTPYPALITSHATNILLCGIASLVFPFAGPVAFMWARKELARIREGTIALDTRPRVLLGQFLGGAGVLLWLIWLVVKLFSGL